MKTKALRTLLLVLAIWLVMQISTVKAQTTESAPFTITHTSGNFAFQSNGKFIITGAPAFPGSSEFSWDAQSGSLVFGGGCSATGPFSTASGFYSSASGYASIALGYNSSASGSYAIASGRVATASGYCSVALGRNTISSGDYSTASGYWARATGYSSTASGYYAWASGAQSIAFGRSATAAGDFSTASGDYTNASSLNSHAVGVYNIGGGNPDEWVPTDPLFEIGNGGESWFGNPAASDRHNALTVFKNGKMNLYPTNSTTASIILDPNTPQITVGGHAVLTANSTTGNVGIGTTSPISKMQINGTLKVATSQTNGIIALGDDAIGGEYVGIFRGTSSGNVSGAHVLNLAGYGGVAITAGNAAFGSQGAPKLFVATSGNVGLGTTSPGAKLDLGSNLAANKFYLYNDGTYVNGMAQLSNEMRIFMDSSTGTRMTFGEQTSGGTFTEYMRVADGGNVGIGTNSPTAKLEVNGSMKVTGQIQFERQGDILMGEFGEAE